MANGARDYYRLTNGTAIIGGNQASHTGEVTSYLGDVQNAPGERYVETGYRNGIKSGLSPSVVQNDKGFPEVVGHDGQKMLYEYSYYMDYSEDIFTKDFELMRQSRNVEIDGRSRTTYKFAHQFDRFKTPNFGDLLINAYGHVFFTRPDCRILTYNGNSRYSLTDNVENDNLFRDAYQNHLDILKQLVQDTEFSNQFMYYLSNKADGFDLSDKTLDTESYGKNLFGHEVVYGRHTEKSKTAGTFSIPYNDTRNLDIYNLHNYWIHYIEGVYRGTIQPLRMNIVQKILDYVCSVYYFVTAEDNETIIYWTKFYGVFPTNTPDSILSWEIGTPIQNPKATINYAYSWRSMDDDPKVLLDFNNNSSYGGLSNDFKYQRTYEPDRMGLGSTWVGAPFVEKLPLKNGTYEYKLRWRTLQI